MRFKATTLLDKFFEAGILLKAFDGLLEIAGGILLLFIKPEYLSHLATVITQTELSEDKRDLLANYIMQYAGHLGRASLLFGALYLLSHGIVKVVLVAEILRNRLWAYLGLIGVTAGFMIYQIYRFALTYSITMLLLTIFDAVVVYLTVIEYNKRRSQTAA